MEALNVDLAVAKFVELRDRKAALKKQCDEETQKLDSLMDGIEVWVKTQMHEAGTTSMKTPHGTAYIAWKESATVADWDAVLGYIKEHEAWGLLEKRVSKAEVKTIMEEDRNGQYQNPPPPGVNFVRVETINVRRS